MKFSVLLLSSLTTSSIAISIPSFDLTIGDATQRVLSALGRGEDREKPERFLIELGPDDRRWISEDEKWALKREGINFMDVTEHRNLGLSTISGHPATVIFPNKPSYGSYLKPLLKHLSKENMRTHLEKFTSFHTRYYKSNYGVESATWLASTINNTISASNATSGAHVSLFAHPWGQPSIIATLPGESSDTVVVGAHQDSINLFFPSLLAAPGADDDGSGTVTILEALRVVLNASAISRGTQRNTLEFHWYSAEEGGLLGSQAVFARYEKEGRKVKAMLQQDMTGYVKGTLDSGKPESVGVVTDFVDSGLTSFVKKIIDEYCDIPYVETKCGYACSDHASASKAGYPSAFIIEASFPDSNHKIHTTEDKIEYLSFDHMLQHAKLTLALAYELAHADFD